MKYLVPLTVIGAKPRRSPLNLVPGDYGHFNRFTVFNAENSLVRPGLYSPIK